MLGACSLCNLGDAPARAGRETFDLKMKDEIPVSAEVVRAEPATDWAKPPRSPDWTFAMLAVALGSCLSGVPRAVGWVIDGFIAPARPR